MLGASGGTNPDTLLLTAADLPLAGTSTIFLKADAHDSGGAAVGDGLMCLSGHVIRLGRKSNLSGTAQHPGPGEAPLSTRGQTPPGSGLVAYYQVWYRNAASFCTPATSNFTNGVRVVW